MKHILLPELFSIMNFEGTLSKESEKQFTVVDIFNQILPFIDFISAF